MAKTRVPEKSMPTYSVFVVDEQEGKYTRFLDARIHARAQTETIAPLELPDT